MTLTSTAAKGSSGSSAALTGATAATRYVGGTASGAPVAGSFLVGDFVIDETGTVWICITAGSPGTWRQIAVAAAQRYRVSAANLAKGFYEQNYPHHLATGAFTPISQTAVWHLVGAVECDVISGAVFIINIAASGTAPTGVYAALYDTAGNRLAVSANVATSSGSAVWTVVNPIRVAFTTPYTVTTTGGYYIGFLQDGAWGTTQVQLGRVGGGNWSQAIQGQTVKTQVKQAAQATFPVSATFADATTDQLVWMAWY